MTLHLLSNGEKQQRQNISDAASFSQPVELDEMQLTQVRGGHDGGHDHDDHDWEHRDYCCRYNRHRHQYDCHSRDHE